MSQQDVQTIREGYEAFNRKDIPGCSNGSIRRLSGTSQVGAAPQRGVFHSAQTVADKVFSLVPENFDDFSADADQFIDSGEHVVVVGHFRGRAKSGTVLDAPFVHVWKMRDGKAMNFYHHVETSAWTKAWGG